MSVYLTNRLVCSYCGQEYPAEKKEQIRANFENNRQEELADLTKSGNDLKAAIDKDKADIEQFKAELAENKKTVCELETQLNGFEKQLSELPESIDISDRPEVQEIQRQIAEKEAAMNKGNSVEEIRQDLRFELNDLQNHLVEVEKQLSLAQRNIDVNSHFELVDFKLFDWLKNGEYKETCIPTYRNKDMGISTNTGLEILMKLDIIRGLQSFYNMYLPVFVDGAEALSESTVKMINMDTQIILLKATEDKELKIEVED